VVNDIMSYGSYLMR